MAAKERKRVNSENADNFVSEPLDVMAMQVVGRDGEKKVVPALNVGFMEPRQYVMYKALPYLFLPNQKKLSTARIDEWLERTSFFEEDLWWLLKLPHNRFWSQVIYDSDLHKCLQSYLSNAPRDYDLNPDAPKEVLSRELTLHKLVFLVFLRMSTYKESRMHHITPQTFSEIIYDNFVFDIARMMDLSVLYWFRNSAILSRMMDNLFSQQPSYISDLEEAIPCILMAFDSVEERLGLRTKNSDVTPRIEDVDSEVLGAFHDVEILDIVNYITDVSATLFTFSESYTGSGPLFFKSRAAYRIPSFYDLVFPLLEKDIERRRDSPENENCSLDVMSTKLTLSKSFLIRFFRSLIATACIQPLLESRCDEASSSDNAESFHLDDFLQTFMEICTEKLFLCHYNYIFPIQTDLDTFSDAGVPLDPASVQYILSCVEPSDTQSIKKVNIQHQSNGPVPTAGHTSAHHEAQLKESISNDSAGASTSFAHLEGAVASPKLDEAELQSLIFMVKEIIPDLGDGFIAACLEYYNYASEKVIDALLCNTLPPSLDKMDRSLQREKLIPDEPIPSVLSERKSIFDYDEFDVFNREDVPLDRIHQGKSKKTPNAYDMLTGEGTSQVLKELILQYEARQEEEEEERLENMYEDEYDDTYDSHGVNIIEPQPESELIRPLTVPIVLRSSVKKGTVPSPHEEREQSEDESDENDRNGQENEKSEPPRDSFCENPEVIRQRAEQRHQTKMRNRGIEPNSAGSSSFHRKERHKGQVANHNRRKQADFKRSRGMGGFPTR